MFPVLGWIAPRANQIVRRNGANALISALYWGMNGPAIHGFLRFKWLVGFVSLGGTSIALHHNEKIAIHVACCWQTWLHVMAC
jgi:hypothetical protein